MTEIKLTHNFIVQVSNVIADCFSGRELIERFDAYNHDFKTNLILPHQEPGETKRLLVRDNLSVFSPKQQYKIIVDLMFQMYDEDSKKEIQKLINHYVPAAIKENISTEQIKARTSVEASLSDFPEALEVWRRVPQYLLSHDYRESLDRARLTIEIVLKQLFDNSKSLENQKSLIGQKISDKGFSKEFKTYFLNTFNSYTSIQNDKVKHADSLALEEQEVRYILNQTVLMMRFLIRVCGENND